jgi:hypothetical protein
MCFAIFKFLVALNRCQLNKLESTCNVMKEILKKFVELSSDNSIPRLAIN